MKTNPTSPKLWFKRKRYGWGWPPSTWQGWLVIAVYTALVCGYPAVFGADKNSFSMPVFIVITCLLTAGLFFICIKKGEKPHWTWGDDDRRK